MGWARIINDRDLLLMHSYQEPKSPRRVTLQSTFESPKRVPDRQMGQPSFVLGGQYPIRPITSPRPSRP